MTVTILTLPIIMLKFAIDFFFLKNWGFLTSLNVFVVSTEYNEISSTGFRSTYPLCSFTLQLSFSGHFKHIIIYNF